MCDTRQFSQKNRPYVFFKQRGGHLPFTAALTARWDKAAREHTMLRHRSRASLPKFCILFADQASSMVWISLYHFQYGVISGVRVAVLMRSVEKMLHSLRW